MNIQQLINQITKQLQSEEHALLRSDFAKASTDRQGYEGQAWWLLQAITNKTKSQLLFEDIELTQDQIAKIEDWVEKITKQHMPIQYLIGHVPFLNCEILVEPPILIPRPETEQWCANLITQLQSLKNKKIKILDMCTGSGCIAIAIAASLPEAHVFAVDISDKAIELTQKNIELNNVDNVTVIKSDLFENLKKIKLDLIVSNPPYIDETLFETLDLSVKNWEDPNALISKEGGLFLIKKIINKAPEYLEINKDLVNKNIPNLVIEIDETQGEQVAELMQKSGFINIQIKKDLYGKDRVVCGLLSDF